MSTLPLCIVQQERVVVCYFQLSCSIVLINHWKCNKILQVCSNIYYLYLSKGVQPLALLFIVLDLFVKLSLLVFNLLPILQPRQELFMPMTFFRLIQKFQSFVSLRLALYYFCLHLYLYKWHVILFQCLMDENIVLSLFTCIMLRRKSSGNEFSVVSF